MRTEWIVALLVACLSAGIPQNVRGAESQPADPTGILRKPIPDKLVVLTFDDGPLSGYSVVAPILKKHGFGGSFYVCDFDSFRTRKDWYMTWRQMRALAADGFEIGNHTVGHGGGLGNYLNLEDELLSHDVPKPTTLAWPVYAVFWDACPGLATNGYIFGRGGHNRPYRPAVDNPFDVPSLGAGSVDEFVRNVRRAVGGKIVVLCYHGVPDMEHPAVSLDPAVFKAQMQYLKDNHYQVIAMRDLAEYIDPAKAAKLSPTSRDYKETSPEVLASEDVPPVRVELPARPSSGQSAPARSPKTVSSEVDAAGIPELKIPQDESPITLEGDRAVTVPGNGRVEIKGVITGSGKLLKKGAGQLRLFNVNSTYSGGTVLDGGSLLLFAGNGGVGNGPLTVNEGTSLDLERVDATIPLILNGGVINAGNGFGDSWNADIALNGEVRILAYNILSLNNKSGGISGHGGLTLEKGGRLALCGTNTYTGPTTVRQGTLIVRQAAALYNADASRWTPGNITVCNTATLQLSVGGSGEFTEGNIGTLLANCAGAISSNGFMGGSVVALDTANATGTVTLAVNVADSKGPGGGPLTIQKCAGGTLRLTGMNTWSGPVVIDGGTVVVSSLNSVTGGKPASSLGAPTTLENGIISLGGDCTLMYQGTGDVTDRILDLTGEGQTVTLDQSGSGLLKFTSPVDISGHGHSKTLVLTGSAAGEFAGVIADPYDRKKTATLSLTKMGPGVWTLSGANRFSGATTVRQGTLCIADVRSLGAKTEVSVAEGAVLNLDFKGEMKVRKLSLGGAAQPAGRFSASNAGGFITGAGVLVCP